MNTTTLSKEAESLWLTLHELQPVINMSITEMAYESANDNGLSDYRRKLYWEVYHYSKEDSYVTK